MAKVLGGANRDIDNLDRLPDELLLRIISLLPFKEAVRTSLLSTRWRYLYASMPNLDFKFRECRIEDLVGFPNVVEKLFRLRKRCLMVVDKLCLSRSVSATLQPLQIQRWVQAVLWHGIRELDLSIPFTVILPPSLFTSKTLEVLKLEALAYSDKGGFKASHARFIVPDTVSLPRLKVLHLLELRFADNDSPSRIVSNCPVLEDLACHLLENDCKLSVFSTSLKYLSIHLFCSKGWSGRFDIAVNVPNIKIFHYSGWGYTSQTILLGETLEQVAFNYLPCHGDVSTYIPNASSLLSSMSSIHTLVFNESILKKLLEYSIPLPVFGHLTRLVVRRCRHGLRALPNFLARCGSLETLQFEDVSKWSRDLDPWIQLEQSRVSCLTSNLKQITFRRFIPGEDQFEAVNYFLKTAGALERLVFTIPEGVDVDYPHVVMRGIKRPKGCRISFLEGRATLELVIPFLI